MVSFTPHYPDIKYHCNCYREEETMDPSLRKKRINIDTLFELYPLFIGSVGLGFKHKISVA